MAWKQRLYAFLLRRVLGPYLSNESLQQLHESMNVSLNDGRLVLGNIRLNASYLTEKTMMQSNNNNKRPLRIVQARVKRLEINLSLRESSGQEERHAYNNKDESSSTTTATSATSVAWRAMQLGREGGVCLMASVLIEGIELDVCPGSFAKPKEEEEEEKDASETTSNAKTTTTTTTLSSSSSASSMISSYVDAALASLKLGLSLKNVRVRLVVPTTAAAAAAGSPKSFLQLHLSNATYRDAPNLHNNNNDDDDRVSSRMQKILDFGGITLETGELQQQEEEEPQQQQKDNHNNDVVQGMTTTKHKILMAKVDGSGQLSWLVSSSSSLDKDDESSTKTISQDIELRIHPQVQVSVTHESIRHCLLVARAFGRTNATEDEEDNDDDDDDDKNAEPTAVPLGGLVTEINQETDYEDVQTVQGIMEQYLEARELAEKNQVRGGILIPSDDDGQDHQVSFDAFFDANEQSFAMYKSVLEESLMQSPNDDNHDDDDDDDHHDGNKDDIQSRFRLHLGECGIKVSFLPDGPSHAPTDYVLCLLGDLNVVASTASSGSAHVNASLGHWEVEASHVLRRGCRPEIVTLLRFDADDDDDDMMSNNVMALAPCVDLQVTLPQRQRRKAKEGTQNETKLDLRLQPIHLLCHPLSLAATNKLVSSIKNNIAELSTNTTRSGDDVVKSVATKEETRNKLSFSVWTPLLEVLVPVETNPDYDVLFRRSGYVSSGLTPSPDSYIGLSMEDVVLSTLMTEEEEDGEKAACQRAIVFVTAPQLSKSLQVVAMKRVDVVALSGLQPIALVHKRLSVERSAPLGASSTTVVSTAAFFPRVPAVSSFKARQEDDDDFQDEFSEQVVSALRIHDPQVGMVRKAERSTVLVDLHVPDISLDLTRQELMAFGRVLLSVSSSTPTAATAKKPTRNKPSQGTKALSVRFDQLTFCIHEDPVDNNNNNNNNNNKDSAASFKLIGSRWEACAVVEDSSPQCARFLCHGFDVYFARHLLRTNETNGGAYTSIQDCCNAIRHRTVRDQNTSALPVFYRSQLFSPLSPESPALQLDAVNMSGVDGETEWNIFFTMYNLTHRFDIDSTWVESLSKLCKTTEREGSSLKSETPETKSSIVKLFVTLADCNVDYTSSPVFDRASRTIVRVSDVRFSSTFVSPSVAVQTFRISLGDLTVLLSNRRHPYNAENARLARSATILPPEQLDIVHGRLDAQTLSGMGLVSVVTLDSMVSLATIAEHTLVGEPKTAVHVTCGQVCLYACKDTFQCFNETVSELVLKFTALSPQEVQALKEKDAEKQNDDESGPQENLRGKYESGDVFYDTQSGDDGVETPNSGEPTDAALERTEGVQGAAIDSTEGPTDSADDNALLSEIGDLLLTEELRSNPTVPTLPAPLPEDFNLDGYDWTTVDHEWSKDELPPGEEQVARWYSAPPLVERAPTATIGERKQVGSTPVRIIPHHIQLKPAADPLNMGDMNAAEHAGLPEAPPVKTRLLLRNLSIRCRFFDGYDWPQDVKKAPRVKGKKYRFLIEEPDAEEPETVSEPDRRGKLMGDLLGGGSGQSSTFRDVPLAVERGVALQKNAEQRRVSRRINCFFQLSLIGVKCRNDSFFPSEEHRLLSCLEMKMDDMFISECASTTKPIKFIGEWFNEKEHPRDSNDGLVMLKMVNWRPRSRISEEDEVVNDEAHGVLQLLPLRCHIDQRAIRFMKLVLGGDGVKPERKWASDLAEIPPPKFTWFQIKSCKLKVNYSPEKMDIEALRDGSVVELINLSPLNDMVILLQDVEFEDKVGFGAVFGGMASSWIQDICATQLYKFVTNASPVQPISSIGKGAADMVILPVDAWKKEKGNSKKVLKALSTGVASFAGSFAYETLNVTSKVTGLAAKAMSRTDAAAQQQQQQQQVGSNVAVVGSRPTRPPRSVWDTSNHALGSLARGLEVANYKLVVVPYREYQRKGTASAAKSVIRGIPVAIMAPVGAASEAVSYTLLGARNQIRPEIRREEEASQRGLYQQGGNPPKF